MFEEAGIEHYSMPHEDNWYTNKYITLLSRSASPYYIVPKIIGKGKESIDSHVRIYDGKMAMLITLYGGVKNYLESTYK